jgi:hypothetical protein
LLSFFSLEKKLAKKEEEIIIDVCALNEREFPACSRLYKCFDSAERLIEESHAA